MAVAQIPAANLPFMQKILQELDCQGQHGTVWRNKMKQNNADITFAISDFFSAQPIFEEILDEIFGRNPIF